MLENFKRTGRIEAIDLLKLFATILVILGHSIAKYITEGTSNPLYNYIWLTQMPLFMFVSGFLNNKPEKVVTIKQYLLTTSKKALTLLVPSISYLLIVSMRDERNIGEAFLFFYLNPQNYLWFLWVLFVIHLVFDFGLYISNKIRSKISFLAPVIFSGMLSIIIVLLMFIIKGKFDFSVLALKLIAYYIPFYCLGYLIHIFVNSDFSQKKHAQNLFCIIAGISFIVVVFISFYFKSIYSFDDSNIRYVLIRVVGSIASILFCTFIADKVIKFVFFAKVSRYGTYSLQSYYLANHFLIINLKKTTKNFSLVYYYHQKDIFHYSFKCNFLLFYRVVF